ncbi:MAG: NADH-quinone oxidoreductase subunit NuoG [Nitrospirota bacterium]|nr:NADH-quinone oxidoreductase subunit NuoG [Nitrospirota bacterium]
MAAPSITTEMVTLTIDGQTATVPQGTLVIEAARQVGVMVPHFCYHPKLTPDANCRMCLVEIEKMPRLQTSCSTPVAEGMVVKSDSSTQAQDARKSVLDFILANHPLDCPVCDQGGRCDLQDFSHEYTATTSPFKELKRVFQKEYFSPLIETQMNRCIQCLRCVRYCDQVMDVKALAPVGRGTLTEIKAFGAHELDCEFCGGCIQICPVGAINSRLSMYEFRPWMLKRTDSICGYCGDGCQITFQTKDNDLIEVNSTHGAGRNNGDLCARGYFGYHVSVHPDRLTSPLIREGDDFRSVQWEEALELVGRRLVEIKAQHGADAIGGLITGRCTNEDIYVFQKFMRGVVGTNRIDSSVRYGHLNGVHALQRVQGTHRWSVSFEDIESADVLLLVGTNITETNPITGLKVKEAVKRHGAKLITIEALEPAIGSISNIVNLAQHQLSVKPTAYAAAILGLLKAAVAQPILDVKLQVKAQAYFNDITARLQALSWDAIQEQTGLASNTFVQTAQVFGEGQKVVILVGPGVLRSSGGFGMSMNLLDLLLITGKLTKPGCGFAPLAEENNDQGAFEMGGTGAVLPGGKSLGDLEARKVLSHAWGRTIPDTPGSSLPQMIEDLQQGKVKALFVVGENPLASLPPSSGIHSAFEKLEFLVCQELFLTETAQQADVVLPACSYAEKDGTFTNTEGHIQPVRKAIDLVGESRPDWEVFSAISVMMNDPMEYEDVKEIGKEIRNLLPGTRTLGPVPLPAQPDSSAIARYLAADYQRDVATRYQLPETDSTDEATHIILQVSQSLFHSGKFSLKAKGLMQVEATGKLYLHPEDAARRGLSEGDIVKVSNSLGEVVTPIGLRERIPQGVVVFPEHFDQEMRQLLPYSVDPETQVPYCKITRVCLEKVVGT